ncbi:MAG: diguanylate cyclase domain-containing protein [Acidiferrobacterales bacterium]
MNDITQDITISEDAVTTRFPSVVSEKKPCLTVLYGGSVGTVHTLSAESAISIGRADDAGVRIEDQRVSRRHAEVMIDSNGTVVLADLGSSNRTYVNGTPIEKQELRDGDRIQIGYSCIIKFSYQDELELTIQEELADGMRNPHTKIYTEAYLIDRLGSEFAHAQRHDEELGLLIFEIDHLQRIISDNGKVAGDHLLQEVARATRQILRDQDVFAHYEEERFAVLARDIGDEGAVVLAQRIRRTLQKHCFFFEQTQIPVTVSIGIATYSDKIKKPAKLIKAAVKGLTKAKKKGGQNCIGGDAVKTFLRSGGSAATTRNVTGSTA